MRKHNIIIFDMVLFLLALTSCNTLSTQPTSLPNGNIVGSISPSETVMNVTPSLSFERSSIDLFDHMSPGYCLWDKSVDGNMVIEFPKIYAINQNVAFVYGEISDIGARVTVRSLLLMTEDGGRHWYELMVPIVDNSIHDLSFIDERNGWALALFSVESPGNITLYRTNDGGKNWFQLATIDVGQLRHGVGTPLSMQFQDENNGRILIGFEHIYVVLDSADGGLTWMQTNTMPLDQYQPTNQTVSQGIDGSEWKLQIVGNLENAHIMLSRRSLDDSDWTIVGVIPRYLRVQDGCVMDP